MGKRELIALDEFCISHQIELTFISSLQENGLIQVTVVKGKHYIPSDELPELERIIRLHNELDINLEGIDSIIQLLEQIRDLQDEIRNLKNELRLFNIQ